MDQTSPFRLSQLHPSITRQQPFERKQQQQQHSTNSDKFSNYNKRFVCVCTVFRQGDDAINWYALLEGSVDVKVAQSGYAQKVS